MQNKNEKYMREYIAMGVCDERRAIFNATAAKLPDGEFGMCVLAVNGNTLSIYDTNMKERIGEHLYTIPLNEVSDVRINDNFFSELIKGYTLRFVYNNYTYTFKNAFTQKNALTVIRSEIK